MEEKRLGERRKREEKSKGGAERSRGGRVGKVKMSKEGDEAKRGE